MNLFIMLPTKVGLRQCIVIHVYIYTVYMLVSTLTQSEKLMSHAQVEYKLLFH